MRFSTVQSLHRKALLRSPKRQTGSGIYMRGAARSYLRKVSEACRPLCIIDKKAQMYEGPLIRDASADVCYKHEIHFSGEDGMRIGLPGLVAGRNDTAAASQHPEGCPHGELHASHSAEEQGCSCTGNQSEAACGTADPPDTSHDSRASLIPDTEASQQEAEDCAEREDHAAGKAQSSSAGGSAGSEQGRARLNTSAEARPGGSTTPFTGSERQGSSRAGTCP